MNSFKRWAALVGTIVLSIGLLVACGAGEDNNATTSDTSTEDLVAIGQEAVNKSCVGCHGTDLQGVSGPSLIGLGLTKEEIYEIVKNGQGTGMPGGLAKGKERAVAEYLASLK